MKRIFKLLTFTLIILPLWISVASANNTVDAMGMNISGLDAFVGKKLSVYYVSARPASLETQGQIARVRKIMRGPLTFVISSKGDVQIPTTSVLRDGWTNFNHVIFVIHAQSKHSLQNVDGSVPEALDMQNHVPFKTEFASFLFRKSLEYSEIVRTGGAVKLY